MATGQTEDPSAGRGKWGDPDVPKRGWTCVEISDLEEPAQICEMCETMTIRFVHFMEHPDYDEVLECGCVCAGHMEGDIEAARGREREMKNLAARRRNWPNRAAWKHSRQGNLTIKAKDFRVTVFQKGRGWGAVVSKTTTGQKVFARRTYPSVRAAQIAAFDRMMIGFPAAAPRG